MSFRASFFKKFILLSLFLNCPPLLAFTKIDVLFIPMLFWINIPVLWTGIARAMGEGHFKIAEFGAMPLSSTAYIVITSFWLFLAAFIAYLASIKA